MNKDQIYTLGFIGAALLLVIACFRKAARDEKIIEMVDLADGRRSSLHISDVVNGVRVHSLYYSDNSITAHVENYENLDEASDTLLSIIKGF